MVAGAIPVRASTSLASMAAMADSAASRQLMRSPYAAMRGGPIRSSACRKATRNQASLAGRMKWCSLASAAVSVRRGSSSTTLPRSTIAFSRRGTPGAVIRLPLEATGLAPSMSRKSVRSRSGTGNRN